MTERILAVSMRGTADASYGEERDAVAKDWWVFLRRALPGVLPLPVPNEEAYARGVCSLPGLVGILLTGGNDLGECPRRDEAEGAALEEVLARGLPALGVCRGMQFLVDRFGGGVELGNPELHRTTRHRIQFLGSWGSDSREVNSFHTKKVVLPASCPLEPTAEAPDGAIEGIQHRELPVFGIHWHPEREVLPHDWDLGLFRRVFSPFPGSSREGESA